VNDDAPPQSSHDAPADEPFDPLGVDDDQPFEYMRSAAQLESVLELLGEPPAHVLELGCGGGRVLVPIAAAGHASVGVDCDDAALQRCRAALHDEGAEARLIEHDFAQPWPETMTLADASFDAALCLGNTFMTIVDVDDAVAVLQRIADALKPGGAFVIDDIAQQYWPELTEGNWCNGISGDRSVQMVWAEDDAVFALRRADAVDEDDWSLKPDDRCFRLWTTAALQLVGRAAGLSVQPWSAGSGVTVLRRDEAQSGT